jgi:hypothetical protein
MDYSQILASQLIRQDTRIDDEEAFYEMLSLDGFAKLRGAFQKVKSLLGQSARPEQKPIRKQMQYN